MPNFANFLIVSSSPSTLQLLKEGLIARQYGATLCRPEEMNDSIRATGPDLILMDLDVTGLDLPKLVSDARGPATRPRCPVVLMASERMDYHYKMALDVGADDVYIRSNSLDDFLVTLQPLLRLSTMFRELEDRANLAQDFGITADTTIYIDEEAPYRILLCGARPGDLTAVETAFEGHCQIETTDDYFEAEEKLTSLTYDAVISDLSAKNSETVLSLSSRARNNPRLFNLPMIAFVDDGLTNRLEMYGRGVTRLCERPLAPDRLKMILMTLVRRQRLRWALRKALETTKADASLDAATTAYSHTFFDAHFSRQVTSSLSAQKNLSVLFFTISNMVNIRKQFGDKAANHLFQQTFQWVKGLTRVEDMVARYGDQEFCVSLPDTPKDEAQVVLHRIAGILSYTDFAVVDVYQPLSIWVEVGMASLEGQETPKDLIERARKNLD